MHVTVTVVEKMKLEDRVKWDWKIIFKKIAPELAHCVEHYLRGAMTTALNAELQEWAASHNLHTVPVRETLWGGRLDYPKVISKVSLANCSFHITLSKTFWQ